MAGGISVFSREFVLILLFVTFIATSIFGTVMIMDGVIQTVCTKLDGTSDNPHFFSIPSLVFFLYYIRYLAGTYIKGRYGDVCSSPWLGVMVEIVAGLFWLGWGIRGTVLYSVISDECRSSHTGNAVLAYAILLIIIGLCWTLQGLMAAKEVREIKTDIEQELLYESPNDNANL